MINRVSLVLFCALGFCVTEPSTLFPAGTKEDVAAATKTWADAFNSRNPEKVLALYDSEAVFWGTTSQIIRADPAAIRDYFKDMPNRPNVRVALGEEHIRLFGDVAIDTGSYTFSNKRDGQETSTPARFTFVYRWHDGRWMIVDHHSSAVPPPRN